MQAIIDWLNIEANTWVMQVFFVVLATVVINFIMKLVLERVQRRFKKTDNLWDEPSCRQHADPWPGWSGSLASASPPKSFNPSPKMNCLNTPDWQDASP